MKNPRRQQESSWTAAPLHRWTANSVQVLLLLARHASLQGNAGEHRDAASDRLAANDGDRQW
jgi:hypothetical protein